MKLSDIFNLPKNAQGNKLFKRITNKYGLSKEDYKALKNIKVGEDTSNARIIKEYYYLDCSKMMSSGDETVNEFVNFINNYFNIDESYSIYTKIIYKLYIDDKYTYLDTMPSYMSGFLDNVKIAIGKYEPLKNHGSGAEIGDVYIDIKKIYADIFDISNESIDEIFNEYSISEEEFWKDAVILD